MRITTIFKKLLGLQGAFVRGVRFTPDAVVVTVAPHTRLHRCPRCKFATHAGYDRHVGEWRHLALGRWRVVVNSTIFRVACPSHGVLTESVAWAAPGSRFTLDFEDLVAWLSREMNRTAVVRLAKVSWRSVGRIVERVVDRTLDKKRLDDLFVIGLDEVSYRKRHKYLSTVVNHDSGDPVWMGEGRSQKTISEFFDELGEERAATLKVVTMDMAAPFIAEVRRRAPQAEIAFDPFHVVKMANEAVHQVRRTEAREHTNTEAADVLKGARWALLKAPRNRTWKEDVHLADVAQLNKRVYRAYLLKEELRALYACGVDEAPTHLLAWIAWALRSRLKPFIRVARTLRKHMDGILAAIRLGVSNGRLEGLNNKIGVIKRRAYGFHSAAALISMVFLCCCKLDVELPI